MQKFIQNTIREDNEAYYQTKKHTCKAPKGSWSHKGSYGIHETQDERRGFIYRVAPNGNEENRQMSIKKGGHTFEGLNKPIKTPNHKSGKAGIFAGSLEFVKEGNLNIKQYNLFDEIYIKEK